MRGLAALIVFTYHIALAFKSPVLQQWSGSPLYVLVNADAAITFFFVLSAYVLTIRALQRADLRAILLGAIKRWPRLAGPVLLVVLFSWLLWQSSASSSMSMERK